MRKTNKNKPTRKNRTTPKTTALTVRQQNALPYLVAGNSVTEAAQLAEISRATLYRWMSDEQFRSEYDSLRQKASDLAHTELKGLMLKAVAAISEGIENENPTVRLRAARTALLIGLKSNDMKSLEKRLDHLYEAMNIKDLEDQP